MNARPRLTALDSLRGVIIILMIAEHARQLLGGGVVLETKGGAGSLPVATVAGGIRFLSHLCAPGFFFLLGVGMVLHTRQADVPANRAWIGFAKRGLGLMLLQVTVENAGWALPIWWQGGLRALQGSPLYLGVLFSLGGTLILAAALLRLRSAALVLLAAILVTSSHWGFPGQTASWMGWLMGGFRGSTVEILYPLLPWTGSTLWGVLFARHAIRGNQVRWTWACGGALTAAAAVLFGWVCSREGLFGATFPFYKYPPTLPFLLATLALLLALLTLFARFPVANLRLLRLLGRHPLAIYLAHLYVLGLASLAFRISGGAGLVLISACVVVLAAWCCAWRETIAKAGGSGCFNRYYLLYDRFMQLFGLYWPEEVKRSLPAGSQGALLDVGGGTGYLAAQLTDRFSRVVVLDQSPGMLTLARRRNLETHEDSALALPFRENEFDAVICTDALHHIQDAERAVAEMARVLKPGGAVVIVEFHIHGPAGWFLFGFERVCIDHSQFIAPAQLHAMMCRHGISGSVRKISRLGYVFEGKKAMEEPTP